MRILAAAMIALACSASGVWATPSTLVWIPSTDIQAEGVWHLGMDNYFSAGSSKRTDTVYGVTYGFERVEVGVDYFNIDSPWFFNAKALLLEETEQAPRLVAGIYNYSPDSDVAQNLVYLLGSKTFSGTRFTLGWAWGREATLGDDNNMVLAGIDRQLGEKWWGAIDYQGGDSSMGAVSAGVAYAVSDNASVLVGYDWYNASGATDTVTVQVDIDLASF